MQHHLILKANEKSQIEPEASSSIGKSIQVLKTLMKKLHHALYRGEIYKKVNEGKRFLHPITFKDDCTLIQLFNKSSNVMKFIDIL